MPVVRSVNYSELSSWEEIFERYHKDISESFSYPKTEFYKSLNIPYKFFEVKNSMLKLTLTYENNRIKCDAFVIGMNRDWREQAGIELSINDFTEYFF